MPRTQTKVDMKLLKKLLDNNDHQTSQNMLWETITTLYNQQKPQDFPTISLSLVRLRILDNWPVKTPKGKRGRSNIHTSRPKVTRTKKKIDTEELEEATPAKFQPLVLKVLNGSRSAAIKLHCLECSGWQKVEVRECVCTQCSLYPFRPYQVKKITQAA